MYDNWLVKLCEAQPTQEAELQAQLGELSLDDIKEIAGEPKTTNLDTLEAKVAQAEQMGRALAHEQGAAIMSDVQDLADVAEALGRLPDEEVVKLAEMADSMDKEAFMGLLRSGLGAAKGLAGKAVASPVGQKAVGFMKQHPSATMAIGGAAANKALGGDPAIGALAGYGAGRLGGATALRRGLSKVASPDNPLGLDKTAAAKMAAPTAVKIAYHKAEANEWLQQFEGTELMPQALQLEQSLLEAEKADLEKRIGDRQRRQQERAQDQECDRLWDIKDRISLDKRLLELQLFAQKSGQSEPDGDELGGPATTADHQEPDGDEMAMAQQGAQMPPQAQQAVPEGAEKIAQAAAKIFGRQLPPR